MMKKAPTKRWRCGDCNAIFNQPAFREVPDADDPTIPRKLRPRGIPILYTCPICESANVRGMANPDPFTPIQVRPDTK
jgi:ribosomal protein L37AE/L43A